MECTDLKILFPQNAHVHKIDHEKAVIDHLKYLFKHFFYSKPSSFS